MPKLKIRLEARKTVNGPRISLLSLLVVAMLAFLTARLTKMNTSWFWTLPQRKALQRSQMRLRMPHSSNENSLHSIDREHESFAYQLPPAMTPKAVRELIEKRNQRFEHAVAELGAFTYTDFISHYPFPIGSSALFPIQTTPLFSSSPQPATTFLSTQISPNKNTDRRIKKNRLFQIPSSENPSIPF